MAELVGIRGGDTGDDAAPPAAAIDIEGARVRLGMIVFLASDVMLFSAFFTAYYLLRSVATEWPPGGVELDVPRAALATLVLVASSFTIVAADRALSVGRRRTARSWVLVTIGLGAIFLANQVAEYATLDFGLDDHPYGSTFWALTGVHGLHVACGLAALTLLFVRLVRARELVSAEPFAAAVSAYWHMVDIVWLAVFVTIWIVR